MLKSGHGLSNNWRTMPFMEAYAAEEHEFFKDFARVMEKLSDNKVMTENQGKIRHNCGVVN